jgi:hypothetical protein
MCGYHAARAALRRSFGREAGLSMFSLGPGPQPATP